MTEANKHARTFISWWCLVLGVDFFLVVITILEKYPVTFPGKARLSGHFDLLLEMNGAVWWSTLCLLTAALLAFELYCRKVEKRGIVWLLLAIVFAVLSLDEIGSLHERVMAGDRSWPELMPFGVALGLLVAFAVVTLIRGEKTKRAAILIGAAFFCYAGVAFQEYWEHIVTWPTWSAGIRGGAEEGLELMGTFFLLLAIIPLRPGKTTNLLSAMAPDPIPMKHMNHLVLAGFLLHSLASILAPSFIDISRQGNPLAWYPVAVFFLLSSAALRVYLGPAAENSKPWAGLSVFFLICSAGFIYSSAGRFPIIGTALPGEYLPGLFLLSVVAGLLFLSVGIPGIGTVYRKFFPVLLLTPALLILSRSQEVRHLAFGLLAYLVFEIFWRNRLKVGKEEVEF